MNPNSIFGQFNRQSTLFSYVASRLHDLNLGQVQYFEQYITKSIDIDGFRSELIESGFTYDEENNIFTYNRKPLDIVSIAVPYQDIPKLHTANFLVNILGDAGISAQIVTINKSNFNREIHSGKYDLSPITEELKPWESLSDTLERIQQDFGYGRVILSFYLYTVISRQFCLRMIFVVKRPRIIGIRIVVLIHGTDPLLQKAR